LRVYAEPNDQTIIDITEAAKKMNVSKADLILKALDHFLHPTDQADSGIDQLRSDFDQLRSELDQARSERDQVRSDADKRWSELNAQKSEMNQLKRELEALRSKNDQLSIKHDRLRSENDQAKNELIVLKKDAERYQDTIKLRDQHISFLESTVHQALEKLPKSLPPSQEEARAKHWWRFWRRG
jgi:chromosome segregation ATPase